MAGRSSRSGGNSNERIQALVDQKLGEGLQYEALQLYRGVVSRKSARGNDDAALAIAEQGIGVLLGRGYADSATELGNVLVGILNDHELPATEERVDLIKRVNAKYEDAKRAAVLAEEDRRAAAQEKEGGVEQGAEGKEAPRGLYSVGVLQVRIGVGCSVSRNLLPGARICPLPKAFRDLYLAGSTIDPERHCCHSEKRPAIRNPRSCRW